MTELSAKQTVQAVDRTIHDVGTTWMLHEETVARSADYGFGDLLAFYFAGRGGVLGDVDANVVTAAMGWWEPGLVRLKWDEGVAVAGAREATRRYGLACAAWGEDHLAGISGRDQLAELAERVVAAVEGSGLPLFAGWRAEQPATSGPGWLLQLIHLLREWRGGLHLVATTAVGLSPLEAILTNEGPGQARLLGWTGEFPDCGQIKNRHDEAEEITNRLAAVVYERALSPAERAEFAGLIAQVGSVVLG